MNLEKDLYDFRKELLNLNELISGDTAVGTDTNTVKAEIGPSFTWKVIGKHPDPKKLERIKAQTLKRFKEEVTKSSDISKAFDITIDLKLNGVTIKSDDGEVLYNGKIN